MNGPILLSLLVGAVIPGVIALITKKTTSVALKAAVTALLSVLSGAFSLLVFVPLHGVYQWEQFIVVVALSWLGAGVAYYVAWKPTKAAEAIANRTARFGFGPKNK
jgi:hypothetical protein